MALSTHSGGAADKAGFFHESLWGVRCMVDVLNGEASAIRIEKPGDDGGEFYLQRGGVREHWQAKRQVTGQETWSFKKLEKVLLFFFDKFRAGESCVFASVADAPELRMLTENAQAAKKAGEDLDHFKTHYLDKKRTAHFEELRNLVGTVSEQETLDFLDSITIHGGREITLEPEFGFRLGVMFQGPWQRTMAALRDLYLRSTHETLTAEDIESYLKTCGIAKRRGGAPDARGRILDVTRGYVEGQRAKLIRRTPIRRSLATEVVAQIQSSPASLDILVTSAAGGGKSACLCQIVEGLQAAGVPVLAFRLDRVEPVPTAIMLGEKLGLGESPAVVLAQAFAGLPVVLVVDQLDCVSSGSGRRPDFFDTVATLRSDVLGLRPHHTIHLLLACRKFDFEHDHRLKQFASKDQPIIELGEFTPEEVNAVLQQEGGDASKLTPAQQAMLRLPQNLSLFIDAGLARTENRFSTPKELCDAYWTEKRKAVSDQRPDFAEHWLPAIQCLARTMSDRQELFVPGAVMDTFPPEFLERMASEGVLTWDGKRYGFGHETFFDYCFARTLPHRGRDFVGFLENDAQHLFRRAQLRQVLAFLRDDDFATYLANLKALLCSERIRPHLKLLAVDLLATHPQARDEELNVLMPAIESEMSRRRNGTVTPIRLIDRVSNKLFSKFQWWQRKQERIASTLKLTSRIWERFFSSRTLFVVVDRKGLINNWLHSGESWLQDTMCLYLRWQTEENAERVAELLEPFAGKADWCMRLRYVMEGRHLEKSRRFFELFLRLLGDGTLDDAKDRFASNGTFWSMLYGLAEKRPAWCAELTARWLDRQIAVANSGTNSAGSPRSFLDDGFGVEDLFKSARGNPNAFLEFVLPSVLRAAATFTYGEDEEEFSRDRLWPTRIRGEHIGMSESLLGACEAALEVIGQHSPDSLRSFINQLLLPRLYTANHLLMTAYLSNPKTFADEALGLLADEPKRLNCGYSDNAYWHARMVIEKCSPHCTDATFQDIEAVVLAFVSPHERTKEGMRWRGNAAYNLASALAAARLCTTAQTRLAEWKEKFRKPDGPPLGIRSYTVVSPIEETSAKHMTDAQWLGAIAKYNTEERARDFEHPERGGALELARMLQKFTQEQPERFAQLALVLPQNSHPYYLSHILRALKDARIPSQAKLSAARRVFAVDHRDCLQSALSLLGSITDAELPDDAVQFIQLAAEYPDPEAELWEGETPYYGGDILTYGINTVRGYSAETIRDLVSADARYLAVFSPTIEKLVVDPSLAVRSCVASTLLAVARHDVPLALEWSSLLFEADDRLLATAYVQRFINQGLREYWSHFSAVIQRMLSSSHEKVKESGGTSACLARLYHVEADALSTAALNGDKHCRLGACEVAKSNLLIADCRAWCETALVRLFSDEILEVRKKAAGCFWHLWRTPDTLLNDFDALIRSFLASPAFADEPTYLLHALEETKHQVPEAVLDVCEALIALCSEETKDIRTSLAADEHTICKLVFTAYAQLKSQAMQTRALNVIDRMNLEGLSSANTHLAEFER
jgi:hypothetical protein